MKLKICNIIALRFRRNEAHNGSLLSVFDDELRVDFTHEVDGHFDDASVESDKSVHFLLDVAHLGVDGCRKSFVNLGYDCFFVHNNNLVLTFAR